VLLNRFEIEKKLKKAKREQRKAKPQARGKSPEAEKPSGGGGGNDLSVPTISERSKERRKNIEDRKDMKKTSAFQDLKARREEKLKKGKRIAGVKLKKNVTLELLFVNCFLYRKLLLSE
jgi:RNA polymerase-associated protein RTF1